MSKTGNSAALLISARITKLARILSMRNATGTVTASSCNLDCISAKATFDEYDPLLARLKKL